MAAKTCIVTTAGLALLAAGPLPITLTKIGIGSGTWTPTVAATAMNTLVKYINITDASVVSANIVHVAVTDTTADVYDCREIGLYVGTTLFAIYAQSTPLFSKAVEALGLFAMDIVMTSVAPGSITVGAAGFSYPQATEILKGVAEIATQSEVDLGVDAERIVTPATLESQLGNYRNHATLNINTSLTVASKGKLHSCSGGITIVLPLMSAMQAGSTLAFVSTGNFTLVQCAGADQIVILGVAVSQVSLNTGDALYLTSDGGSNYYGVIVARATQYDTETGTADAVYVAPKTLRFGFSCSFTADGYIALPKWLGGFIFQWKSGANSAGSGHQLIYFPIPFPSNCFAVFVSTKLLGAAPSITSYALSTYSLNLLDHCQVYRNVTDGLGATPLVYAIGR